jgi:hypothetical protein
VQDEYEIWSASFTWNERRANVFWNTWVGVGTDEECWRWLGHKDHNRRGYYRYDGRKQLAHRVAWQLQYGEIPEGMKVCHKCDVRDCCNPKHLYLGTSRDNTEDMILKGRARFGGKRIEAKRCQEESQVVEIKGA